MGYFSDLDLNKRENQESLGYQSLKDQLVDRYEALRDRIAEPFNQYAFSMDNDDLYFSRSDYRYAPIECFKSAYDVERALDIVIEDLEEKCGVVVRDDGTLGDSDDEYETDPNQISIFEIVCLSPLLGGAVAA